MDPPSSPSHPPTGSRLWSPPSLSLPSPSSPSPFSEPLAASSCLASFCLSSPRSAQRTLSDLSREEEPATERSGPAGGEQSPRQGPGAGSGWRVGEQRGGLGCCSRARGGAGRSGIRVLSTDLTGRGCPEQVRALLGVSKGQKGLTLAPSLPSLLSHWEAQGDGARGVWLCLLGQGPPAPRKPRLRGRSETSGGVSRGCPGPRSETWEFCVGHRPRQLGPLGAGCNRAMSQRPGASRTLGAPGLSRATWAGQFLLRSAFKNNANVAAARGSSHLGPPRSQPLCSPASEPPVQATSIPATGSGEALEMPEGLRSAVPSGT